VLKGEKGRESAVVDMSIDEVDVDSYEGLLIPGGHSPDVLRADDRFVEFVRAFDSTGRPIAAVCHGPQLLLSAELQRGRTMTAWPTVQGDLRQAGANVIDRAVVVDDNWITSRNPGDLQAFTARFVEELGELEERRAWWHGHPVPRFRGVSSRLRPVRLSEPTISHVSDTARWVAVYRAWETARPDALFRDPFADRLAGETGRAIAAATPRAAGHGLGGRHAHEVDRRSRARCDRQGCDRVLNLAAGFDARPYRLPLPKGLTWIEADLPALIDEKRRLLDGETPACNLVREAVDLADSAARAAFLARAVQGAARALVITEGLVVYLTDDTGAVAGARSGGAVRRPLVGAGHDVARDAGDDQRRDGRPASGAGAGQVRAGKRRGILRGARLARARREDDLSRRRPLSSGAALDAAARAVPRRRPPPARQGALVGGRPLGAPVSASPARDVAEHQVVDRQDRRFRSSIFRQHARRDPRPDP
jgi:PfpI family intracellular protease